MGVVSSMTASVTTADYHPGLMFPHDKIVYSVGRKKNPEGSKHIQSCII